MSYGEKYAPSTGQGGSYAPLTDAAKEATTLIDRLNALRGSLEGTRIAATSIADKIVGHEPAQIGGKCDATQAPAPFAFLAQVSLAVSDLEMLVQDTACQINRLHRSF